MITSKLISEFNWPDNIADFKILDLACGSGRNGLFFANKGADVTFIDRQVCSFPQQLARYPNCQYKVQDLEQEPLTSLGQACYDLVIVANYLHRPLMPLIKACIKPQGLICYETFTQAQALIGRPRNPNFLLNDSELLEIFDDWHILKHNEEQIDGAFKAQLIAQK